ncbi:MAG: VWA domain-containing protein [Bdellovibrionales bacterium]|nr:VWA domain-containing protein [Bdellovibrionales bacterium]
MWGKFFKALVLMGFSFGIYIGCSEVNFEEGIGPVCSKFRGDNDAKTSCLYKDAEGNEDGYEDLTYPTKILRRLDLLFVIDNSGSMYEDQQNIARNFDRFIREITNSDANVSYQIGIITADVSGDKHRAGTLMPFEGSGRSIISNDPNNPYYARDAVTLFKNTIKRKETLECETSGFDPEKCTSKYESGIAAVNAFLNRGNSSFFRSNSRFSIIIVSDEDENSRGEKLKENNLPETLSSKVFLRFGASKSFSVNAIAVVPGDLACLDKQNERCGKFYKKNPSTLEWNECTIKEIINKKCHKYTCANYANTYAKLVSPSDDIIGDSGMVSGVMGNICKGATDYNGHLGRIAREIKTHQNKLQLHCAPINDAITVELPRSLRHISYSKSGRILIFSQVLPKGTIVKLKYKCLRSI